jgi:hypothetical protein
MKQSDNTIREELKNLYRDITERILKGLPQRDLDEFMLAVNIRIKRLIVQSSHCYAVEVLEKLRNDIGYQWSDGEVLMMELDKLLAQEQAAMGESSDKETETAE